MKEPALRDMPGEPQPVPDVLPGGMDDAARLEVLRSFEVDALEDDPELLAITGFAARLCNVPVAQVTLVEDERQHFLAGQGMEAKETPRSVSFCNHAMMQAQLMEVCDTHASAMFRDNPLVTGAPHIRYYAGYPLISEEGAPLGALCIVDTEPRAEGLNALQREGLAVLAQAVMRRLNSNREAVRASSTLAESEEQLRTLADSIPAIAWSTDADGKFEYFNKGLVNYIGSRDRSGAAFHPDDWERCTAAWHHALATGEAYEVQHRLRNADGEYRWMLSRAVPMRNAAGRIIRWFGTAVDIDDVHRLSDARDLLSKELAHRIKNIFAVVIGLVSLESRREPEHREFAENLMETLRALSRAHEFVRPAGGDTREGLVGLLEVLFAPYGSSRVRISGEDALISARAATPLALVFHELATNAAKYGALSKETGEITLEVRDAGEDLRLIWRERGGPPLDGNVPQGEESGFGSRLVEMSVTGQLGGSWVRRFEEEGLVVELTVSKEAIAP